MTLGLHLLILVVAIIKGFNHPFLCGIVPIQSSELGFMMFQLLPNHIEMYNKDLMLVQHYSQLPHQIIHTKL